MECGGEYDSPTMDLSRLSACSYPLRKEPLEEALRVIAGAGFDKVDLLGVAEHFPPQADAILTRFI